MVKATRRSVCHPPTSLSPILEFNVVFKNIATTVNNCIVHYTSGRFGKTSLRSLYGSSVLPVLHNSTSLALPIMSKVHQGYVGVNHWKSPPNMSGGSEQYALIYNPHNLAHQVSRNCPRWSLEDAKNNQKTDQVVPDCQTPSPPFSNLSADLAGLPGFKYKEGRTWYLICLCNVL